MYLVFGDIRAVARGSSTVTPAGAHMRRSRGSGPHSGWLHASARITPSSTHVTLAALRRWGCRYASHH
jgi:hypothetical protein